MRQAGKSGFSASQAPHRRGTRKGTWEGGLDTLFMGPASLGSSLERQAAPCLSGSALQGPEESVASQVSYLCKEWLSLVPVSYTKISMEGIPFGQAIQMHCPYRLTRQFNSEKICCSLVGREWELLGLLVAVISVCSDQSVMETLLHRPSQGNCYSWEFPYIQFLKVYWFGNVLP